ncbi:MAG: hypothetical protein WC417_04330 [Candidatus Omnitrophota bacterium]|jgi:hypothetical protein
MTIIKRFLIFLGLVFSFLLILSFTSFFILKNLRIKEIIEDEIEHSLGINVTIEKVEFSPLFTRIGATGITIHNPAGFLEDELAYINSIYFVFDPAEMLSRNKPNIYLFAFDLKRLNIIKNSAGKVNIKEIIPVKDEKAEENDQTPFYFDVAVLSIGEVKYTDYTQGVKKGTTYRIGIKNAAFVGLKDEQELTRMIIYKAIENTDIGRLVNLKIIPVVSQVGDTIDAAWATAKSGVKSAWSIVSLPVNLIFGKK